MSVRGVDRIIRGLPASDGAGVRLRRSLGQSQTARLDPFLMLDEIASNEASDYAAGFPPHPHRGFETVTYMLEGRMRHEDHLGNRGLLISGGVQWMTAGRGIVHSEMPEQEDGRLHGFQLWLNLPAAEKMRPPTYRDITPDAIPEVTLPTGGRVRVIAGAWETADERVTGAMTGITTEPLMLDVRLPADAVFDHPMPSGHNGFAYVYAGELRGPSRGTEPRIAQGEAGVFTDGDALALRAGDAGARFLLLAARPLGEPVVQYGPFVMNTRAEIEQALHDYRTGQLAT